MMLCSFNSHLQFAMHLRTAFSKSYGQALGFTEIAF